MKKTLTNSANISGFQNEDVFPMLSRILKRKGYLIAEQKNLDAKAPPIFSVNNTIRADFYFEGKPIAPSGFVVSTKYQENDGTADSKVYYEVEYVIKQALPCPAVLLVRGDHWLGNSRQRARKWLENQVDGKRLRGVFFSVDDLVTWASGLPECTGFVYKNGHARPEVLPGMEQVELF